MGAWHRRGANELQSRAIGARLEWRKLVTNRDRNQLFFAFCRRVNCEKAKQAKGFRFVDLLFDTDDVSGSSPPGPIILFLNKYASSLPAHVPNPASRQWREHQRAAGAHAPCRHTHDDEAWLRGAPW